MDFTFTTNQNKKHDADKEIRKSQELYAISPACMSDFFANNKKQMWKILFISLFSAIIIYYTTFQLTIGSIFSASIHIIDSPTMAFAIIISILIFILMIGIATKLKSFSVTYTLLIIIIGSTISVSGVLILCTSLIPDMRGADAIKIFVILFPTNIIISMMCFYIARKLVCRIPEQHLQSI